MNSVCLVGRLSKDPVVSDRDGRKIANFTIAVDRAYAKDKSADFIRIVVFGKAAENCEKFLAKGLKVSITGRLHADSYVNKEGKTVYTVDVIADRVEFLEWKGKDGAKNAAPKADVPKEPVDDDDVPF